MSLNRMLNDSPFYLIFGRDPVFPQDLMVSLRELNSRTITAANINEYKATLVKNLASAYEKLNKYKESTQEKYKNYYDKTHKPIKFEIGDMVMVFIPATTTGLSYKLLSHWEGPYEVLNRINAVTYRIKVVKGHKIELRAVHVQQLKKYKPWQQIR